MMLLNTTAGPVTPAPPRIVHLITTLDNGGAEGMLCRLVTRMERSRFENVVISLSDEG